MNSKHRTDANHVEIIQAFEDLGCSVVDLSSAPRNLVRNIGLSDLLIGTCGTNQLVEIKTVGNNYNLKQIAFGEKWRGEKPNLVRCTNDVIDLVQRIRTKIKTGYHNGII